MKAIKGILIDSEKRILTPILVSTLGSSTDIKAMQRLIGCRCFTIGGVFENEDAIFVDDEGLLKSGPTNFFMIEGVTYNPIAGNGLILGTNIKTGDSIDVRSTIEEIAGRIRFAKGEIA